MKSILCCVTMLLATPSPAASSLNEIPKESKSGVDVASRIENNLLPVHYLRGQVDSKSIQGVMLEDRIPGVSMAFVDKGTIAWTRAYGHAQLHPAKKVTAHTVFTGASLSKPVAAMAALRLVDQGALSLDEDVNENLDGWKIPDSEFTRQHPVTLRRLIAHTAGIGNHLLTSYEIGESTPTLEQMLAGEPPSVDPAVAIVAEPGEIEKYSNPGYIIIQKLIVDATDQPFDEAAQELVFGPAGMDSSSFTQPIPERLRARMATGYIGDLDPYPYKLFPFEAAGGIWSTPSDMARFLMAVMDDYHTGGATLISRELAEQVFARNDVRLGFAKKIGERDDELIFDHWGSNAGFTCYLVGSLEDKQALVIMTNGDDGFELMAAIARAVAHEYDWPVLQPEVFDPVYIAPEQLKRYTGQFGNNTGDGDAISFSIRNGELHVSADGEEEAPRLVAISGRKFIHAAEYTTYEFIEAKSGGVRWVRVTRSSGYNYDLPRRWTNDAPD